jgi:hypothetical protein
MPLPMRKMMPLLGMMATMVPVERGVSKALQDGKGSRQVTAHGEVARLFRGVPIGAKRTP